LERFRQQAIPFDGEVRDSTHAIYRSTADDVAVVDGPANQRTRTGADDRAERLRSAGSDDVPQHAAADAADDQAGRAVIAPNLRRSAQKTEGTNKAGTAQDDPPLPCRTAGLTVMCSRRPTSGCG